MHENVQLGRNMPRSLRPAPELAGALVIGSMESTAKNRDLHSAAHYPPPPETIHTGLLNAVYELLAERPPLLWRG